MDRTQLYNIKTGKQFVPVTHTKAVLDDDGNTVEDRLSDIEDALEIMEDVNSVARNVIDSTAGFYFSDNDGNVAAEISEDGVFDCAAIGDNLKALINANSDDLPTFLQEEYSDTIESLASHPFPAIAFATDFHIRPESSPLSQGNQLRDGVKRMMTAMRMISKQFPMRLAVLGGDYIQGKPASPYDSDSMVGKECIMDLNKWFAGVDCQRMAISGNHEEYFTGNSSTSTTGLTLAERHALVCSKYMGEIRRVINYSVNYNTTWETETDSSKKMSDGKKVYYYLDHESQICYVFYDTVNASDNTNYAYMMQEVWAANTDDYPYVFFNHFSINASDNYAPWGGATQVINFFQTNGHTNIIAWIGGHSHFDDWTVHTNSSYPPVVIISCLQAGLLTPMPNSDNVTLSHTYGTATESAMSLFQIDQANKTIYQTQFGLGDDHVYTYGTTPTRDGEPLNS